MPLGVPLSELRYELRAEIYSSLLPAHGLSSVDMQNVILARVQRELYTQYAWPHLDYAIDFDLPANTQYVSFDPTLPFENVLGLWRNYNPSNQQPWVELAFGFDDSINEMLHSFPPTRWRNVVEVDNATGLTEFWGRAQIWPIPSQLTHMRWHGQAPLNPLKLDGDRCMIDSTAIVLTAAAELLGAQKGETAALKGQKAQAYVRRLVAKSGANKRDIYTLGQGMMSQPTYNQSGTPFIDWIPGP